MLSRCSLRKIKNGNENGNAVFMALILSFIMGAVSLAAFRTIGRHSANSASQDEMQEVLTMQRTIMEQMDCFETLKPTSPDKAEQCNGKPIILRDRASTPLYPTNSSGGHSLTWRNPRGVTVPSWELKAVCKNKAVFVEKKQIRNDGNRSFFAKFSPLWPISRDPELCMSYFDNKSVCDGKYSIFAGGGREYPLCCRAVSGSGMGGAAASCEKDEFASLGGAWCGGGNGVEKDMTASLQSAKRCVIDTASFLKRGFGSGTAYGFSFTTPSMISWHTDPPIIPLVPMFARINFPSTKALQSEKRHGGFLLQNGYSSLNGSASVDTWVASCKYDDWQGAFETRVRAFCCRKKQ
jgi:hypothetical protein